MRIESFRRETALKSSRFIPAAPAARGIRPVAREATGTKYRVKCLLAKQAG